MGHQRLGAVPKSRKWDAVVGEVVDGSGLASDDIAQIAARTLEAAGPALERAVDDPGLRYTFYLLTQIVLAARQDDWQAGLARAGITLTDNSSIFDLTTQLQLAIDGHVAEHAQPTDISEDGTAGGRRGLVDSCRRQLCYSVRE